VAAHAPIRLLAIAVALTGVFALSTPGPATAGTCLDRILKDWFPDERIDGSYSQACYRAAERDLPQDLRDYSDLPSEIASARLRDVRASHAEGGDDARRLAGAGVVDERNDGGSGNSGDGAIGSALDALGPDSADSAPIPLLVLSGLALLLIAAGAAGLLARKVQARRARAGGPSPTDPQV
jgi:hypothetical protein